MNLKICLMYPDVELPTRATDGAACMDLEAFFPPGEEQERWIDPGEVMVVPTGIRMEVADFHEVQIRSRSGLAAKNKVLVLNSPGTVDSDYRGEVKVILYNAGRHPFPVHTGDRIAQFRPVEAPSFGYDIVPALSESARGSGGFGSTGQ